MPTAPTVKRKSWTADRVQHQRVKDMRWFYNSRKWRSFSKDYKVRNPFCIACDEEGIVKAAMVTDHIKTYEEDAKGFDLDALHDKYMQPMCKKHHDSKSGREGHKK
tara:strand:- start:61 stop:378 length:318 start_codon:yes stop_codon:yes gene_type:complete